MHKITIKNQEVELTDEQCKEIVEKFGKKKGKTRPNRNEVYWFITTDEQIAGSDYITEYDKKLWKSGNGFFTEAEAKKELLKRQATQRIKDFIIENGLEFVPDWSDGNEKRWYIRYWNDRNEFQVDYYFNVNQASPFYFKSSEDAKLVIDNCKDDLLIVYGITN